MGEVFLAYDRHLDNDVAIKRLTPQLASSPELRESLTKEARILARLTHSSIVRLFDLYEFSGDFYLILEYVCGPSMREMLRSGYRASPLELAGIMEQICQGLTVAHENGVIHRDLKPGNLLIALRGEERAAFASTHTVPANLTNATIKITDFGIAKAIADSRLTYTNPMSGTPGYMAPEQSRGEQPSPQTDVYALGAITCELLTGKLPSRPVGTMEGVHEAVTEVVAKAMSPARADRFPSAAAFYEALCNGIEGRSPRRLKPAWPALTKKQKIAIACVVPAIAVAVGAIVITTEHSKPRAELVQSPFADDHPIQIEWRSPPRATELPPIVEEARGSLDTRAYVGPRHPKVQWTITLPDTGTLRIAGVGRDGTVYTTGFLGEVCAIRDGKLQWAYKAGTFGASGFQIDDDGRIWMHSIDSVYCFNRDGKGGRLPAAFKAPETNSDSYNCVMNHTLWGPGWKMDLDGECSSSTVATAPTGPVYVGTDTPQILAVSKRGAVQWTFTPQCTPTHMTPTLTNHLVFACKDHTLHELGGNSERWAVKADGDVDAEMLVDSGANLYYTDYGRQSGITHIHSLDANGKERWTVDLRHTSARMLVPGDHNRLYVAGSSLHGRLLCLSD